MCEICYITIRQQSAVASSTSAPVVSSPRLQRQHHRHLSGAFHNPNNSTNPNTSMKVASAIAEDEYYQYEIKYDQDDDPIYQSNEGVEDQDEALRLPSQIEMRRKELSRRQMLLRACRVGGMATLDLLLENTDKPINLEPFQYTSTSPVTSPLHQAVLSGTPLDLALFCLASTHVHLLHSSAFLLYPYFRDI